MNFPIFEHYLGDDEELPRPRIIELLERHPTNDLDDITVRDNFVMKQLQVNNKVKLILVYNVSKLPDEEELDRMRNIAIRVSQGDKIAINHVLSSFRVPI